MKTLRKTTATILAVAFAMGLTFAVSANFAAPTKAHAAGVSKVEITKNGTTETKEFGSAYNAWVEAKTQSNAGNAATLILGENWEHDEQLTIEKSKSLTIDLNGHYIKRTRDRDQISNGSVFLVKSGATLTVEDSRPDVMGYDGVKGGVITGGASGNGAGGVHIEEKGHVVWQGGTLYSCITDEDGGGFYLDGSSEETSLTMTGGRIYACQTIDSADRCFGGAIYVECGTVNISNAEIDSCYSEDSGGAFYINDGKFNVYDTVFSGNHAADHGGAVYLEGDALIYFRNCIFAGNQAHDSGGAVYIDNNPDDDMATIFDGCVFRNNTAGERGGAIFIDDDNVALINVTIENNTAKEGGGGGWVDSQSDITFKGKCIVKNNTCTDNSDFRNVTLQRYGAAKAYVWSAGLTAGSYIGINSDASADDIKISPEMSKYQLQYFHADAGSLVMRAEKEVEADMVVTASLFNNGYFWVSIIILVVGALVVVGAVIYRKKKLAAQAAGGEEAMATEQPQKNEEEDD